MHLGEKLKAYKKQNDKDQKEMADLLGFSVRKYAEIERTGEITKVEDEEVIYELIGENKQKDAYSTVKYETKEDILRMLEKSLDANTRHAAANEKNANNLTALVRMLAKRINSTGSGSTFPPSKEGKKRRSGHEEHNPLFVDKEESDSTVKKKNKKGISSEKDS